MQEERDLYLTISLFLFLLDCHASYCFNPVLKIYFTHPSSILPVTGSFYCHDISHDKRSVAAENIFRG